MRRHSTGWTRSPGTSMSWSPATAPLPRVPRWRPASPPIMPTSTRCGEERNRSTRAWGRMPTGSPAPTNRTWSRPEPGRGLLLARGFRVSERDPASRLDPWRCDRPAPSAPRESSVATAIAGRELARVAKHWPLHAAYRSGGRCRLAWKERTSISLPMRRHTRQRHFRVLGCSPPVHTCETRGGVRGGRRWRTG